MAPSNFENIFTSHTRSKALLSLANFEEAVCVNELADLIDCSLCSVHAAVRDLVKEKVLQITRQRNETKYSLNQSSASFELIIAIKKFNEQQQIRFRANTYSQKAKRTLKFISDSHKLMSKINKPRDD